MDSATTEKLLEDLRAVVRDAEALLAQAGERAGEEATGAAESALDAAHEIDAQVRRNPWAAVGIAAGAGLLLGLLLGRK
jgi:ElaB/YqjD/DUF883 family membrane-anchored ribosome-binding protein